MESLQRCLRDVQDLDVEVKCSAGQRMVEIQDDRIVFHFGNTWKDLSSLGGFAFQLSPNFLSIRRYHLFVDLLKCFRIDGAVAFGWGYRELFFLANRHTLNLFLNPRNNLVTSLS